VINKRGEGKMSVTILPYIDDKTTQELKAAVKVSEPVTMEEVQEDFKTYLDNATNAQKAMAVDALIAANKEGSVTAETVEKLLGFNPFGSSTSGTTSTTETEETSDSSDDTAAASTDTTAATSAATTTETTSTSSSSSSNTGALKCSSTLQKYFEEAAEKYNVDVNLLKAMAKVESNFDASATSSAGAMGIMQLMPSTAKGLGISDAYDAYDNIMGGAKIISQYLKKYSGDTSLALAAYNAGGGNVDKYGGIPPFSETKSYVKKVLSYYNAA
jgi:soluble lytic murein transglycosylase-like protein